MIYTCSKTDRIQKACECYRKSLKLNPLLWKSYEALCQLGAKVDPCQIFTVPNMPSNPSPPTSVLAPHPTPTPVSLYTTVVCQQTAAA